MTSHDHVFTVIAGFDGSTYYAQLADQYSDQYWDNTNSRMTSSFTYADTALSAVDVQSTGRLGVTLPTILPAGSYHLILKKQAGGTPAAADNLAAEVVDIRKDATGRIYKS